MLKTKNVFKRKNGIALNQAFGAILMLVLVAVLVIIGIILFVSLISGPFVNIASLTVVDESLTPSGNASVGGTPVTNSTFCNFGGMSVGAITNASGILVPTSNYTATGDGFIRNNSQLLDDETPWNVNYSASWGSEACTASEDMVTQFGTYPALVGLVGTIIFLGLVIGVLVASFIFGRKREGV